MKIAIKIISCIVVFCILVVLPFMISKCLEVKTESLFMDWTFGFIVLEFLVMLCFLGTGIGLGILKSVDHLLGNKKKNQHDCKDI